MTLSDARTPDSIFYRIALLSTLAVLVGGLTALGAIAFLEAVNWLNDILLISPRARIQIETQPWLISLATVVVPCLGGLLVGALLRLSPEKRPLGPPDVIGAVQLRQPLPSARGGVITSLASVVSLGFGASVGQYGPMVYLGASIGQWLQQLPSRIRDLPAIAIACGVAAAISTAFNAPIAGLVFAHEVILRHYSIRAFAPTTVASATGYVVANVIFERPPLFLVDFNGVHHGYEFLLFALLGLGCALLAIVFMRLLLWTGAQAARSPLPVWSRPAFAGLLLGLTALWLPDVLSIGKESLRFATIEGAFDTWELVLLVVAKMAVTALCIGYGFAGGVFSPALLVGVLFGALFWNLLAFVPGVDNSGIVVYAICGMMALSSPIIGAPLTTILIVFELTRSYDLTVAAMVSVVFANLLVCRLFGRSLFDVQLQRRGVDLSEGRDRAMLSVHAAVDVGRADYVRCRDDQPLHEALEQLRQSPWSEAFVVDAEGRFLGQLRAGARVTDAHQRVASAIDSCPICFDTDTSVWDAMLAMPDFVGDAVPLLDSDGRLHTVITEAAIIQAYLDIVHGLRREENAPL